MKYQQHPMNVYNMLPADTVSKFCIYIDESRFLGAKGRQEPPNASRNIFFYLKDSVCSSKHLLHVLKKRKSKLCTIGRKERYFSQQFVKESVKITIYCYGFDITQLTITVIVCYLHMSFMEVQCLLDSIFTQHWPAQYFPGSFFKCAFTQVHPW